MCQVEVRVTHTAQATVMATVMVVDGHRRATAATEEMVSGLRRGLRQHLRRGLQAGTQTGLQIGTRMTRVGGGRLVRPQEEVGHPEVIRRMTRTRQVMVGWSVRCLMVVMVVMIR